MHGPLGLVYRDTLGVVSAVCSRLHPLRGLTTLGGRWRGGGVEGRGDVGSDIDMMTKMAGARHINFGRFCVYRVIKSLTYVSSSVNTDSVCLVLLSVIVSRFRFCLYIYI